MADYFKLALQPAYSTSSDYSADQLNGDVFDVVESRPDSKLEQSVSLGISGTITIDLSSFDTVHALMIQNNSASYDVTIGYTDTAANAQDPLLGEGGLFVCDSVDPASDVSLTSTSSGAVLCRVVVVGVLAAL